MSRLALLFPGQGAHKVGMGRDLYEAYPEVKALYEQAQSLVDFDLIKLSFEGPEEELRRTDVSQPAIVVASLAALKALECELGEAFPEVAAACGMSLGEYTALAYAGVLSLGDALALVAKRGRFMQECCEAAEGGMMTVLGIGVEQVREAIAASGAAGVGVANDNAPSQVVISGLKAELDKVSGPAKAAGARRLLPLSVAGAYHSELMAPAGEKLAAALASVSFGPAKATVLANVDAAAYEPGDAEATRDRLVRQVSGAVRWRESMTALAALEIDAALELGPGGVLKGLMKKNQRSIAAESLSSADEIRAYAAAIKA